MNIDPDYDYDYGEDKDKPIEMHPDWFGEWDGFIDFCLSEPMIKVPLIKYTKKIKVNIKKKRLPMTEEHKKKISESLKKTIMSKKRP